MTSTPKPSASNVLNMFANLKVGHKVAVGCGTILAFLCVVSAVGYYGLAGATSNFKKFQGYALQTNQLGRIQANVLTARLHVKDYVLKNTDAGAKKVRESVEITAKMLEEARHSFTRKEAVELIEAEIEEADIYKTSFEAVAKLMTKKRELVDEMNRLGPLAEKDLTSIMDSAFRDGDVNASFLAGMSLRSLLLARLYASRFLVDNKEANAERVRQELEMFEFKNAKMVQTLSKPARKNLAAKVLKAEKGFAAAFSEVVGIINERNKIVKGTLDVIGSKLAKHAAELKHQNKEIQDELGTKATQEANSAAFITGMVSIIALLLGAALAWIIGRAISKPVNNMTSTMRKLASGDLSVDIPALGQSDEVGQMADAVLTFKDAAIEKERIEREADETRNLTEKERADREAAKALEAASLSEAIESLASGLQRLSEGDLAANIDKPFAGDLDRLRKNFNTSVSKLAETMSEVTANIGTIHTNSSEMRTAMEDLSHRTEQQAASLEETSASLEQLTATVQSSSERAQDATKKAAEAKASSDSSTQVVSDAVDAMSRIQNASGEIAKIIGVIDEIAFQTNLLALNAGVEAARAGDAGKGFAVVAQEVRELAQRSASAAKEIKDLISKSTDEVEGGVSLVKATGEALGQIADRVSDINEHIDSIATAAREQATGLREINTAVSEMDQVTQQNAAAAEETTAITHGLADEANGLAGLVSRFSVANATVMPASATPAAAPRPGPVAATRKPSGGAADTAPEEKAEAQKSPAKAMINTVRKAFGGRSEGNAAVEDEDWREF